MKNLKKGSRPRRTEKKVASTGTDVAPPDGSPRSSRLRPGRLLSHARCARPGLPGGRSALVRAALGSLVLELADRWRGARRQRPAARPPVGGDEAEQEDDRLADEEEE